MGLGRATGQSITHGYYSAQLLMDQALLEHNEWVVEASRPDKAANGTERASDGAERVWTLRARWRGTDVAEDLRLAMSPEDLRRLVELTEWRDA